MVFIETKVAFMSHFPFEESQRAGTTKYVREIF